MKKCQSGATREEVETDKGYLRITDLGSEEESGKE